MHKICEICKKAPATVHLTDIHDNVKREIHMCEACAESKGIAIKHSLSIQELLGNIAGSAASVLLKRRSEPTEDDLCCEHCGMKWGVFRSGGRLGCPEDYVAFRDLLVPLFEEIHVRGARHVGKRPHRPHEGGNRQKEMLECRRRLQDAIRREAYEEAARLRDRIASLQAREDVTSPPR